MRQKSHGWDRVNGNSKGRCNNRSKFWGRIFRLATRYFCLTLLRIDGVYQIVLRSTIE